MDVANIYIYIYIYENSLKTAQLSPNSSIVFTYPQMNLEYMSDLLSGLWGNIFNITVVFVFTGFEIGCL